MSILDKAKAAAQKAAEAAQKGASQVQGKVEQVQTRKKADDLAKQLGYLIVRERSGGEAAGPQADDLVAQIRTLETQLAAEAEDATGGNDLGTPPSPPPASEPGTGESTG